MDGACFKLILRSDYKVSVTYANVQLKDKENVVGELCPVLKRISKRHIVCLIHACKIEKANHHDHLDALVLDHEFKEAHTCKEPPL